MQNPTFFPAEFVQKSPVVRPKDSACLATWKESPEEQRAAGQEELAFKDQTVYSYQQISCLDSVIRYKGVKSRHCKNWWDMFLTHLAKLNWDIDPVVQRGWTTELSMQWRKMSTCLHRSAGNITFRRMWNLISTSA